MTNRESRPAIISQPQPPTAISPSDATEQAPERPAESPSEQPGSAEAVGPSPGSLLDDMEGPPPPPAIMDKQLEAVARKVKPIVVDPGDPDGTAKRIREYDLRAQNCEKVGLKSAVRAGVYRWHVGEAFRKMRQFLWPRRKWTAWYRKHGWQKDRVSQCVRFRAAFDDPKELCKYDSLGAMDRAAKAIIAERGPSHSYGEAASQDEGGKGDTTTERDTQKGKEKRDKNKKKLDLARVPHPVFYVEQLAQQQYKGTELHDQIVEILNLAVERGGLNDRMLLALAARVLYCCDRRGVEKHDWDQAILARELDKLKEVGLQYARRASPVWLFETVATLIGNEMPGEGSLSEKERHDISQAVEGIRNALQSAKLTSQKALAEPQAQPQPEAQAEAQPQAEEPMLQARVRVRWPHTHVEAEADLRALLMEAVTRAVQTQGGSLVQIVVDPDQGHLRPRMPGENWFRP
jgi:hypothetical protein